MLASDADRDRVVQALQEAYVQGRLTHDELSQRLNSALRARTVEETETLLADLPRPPAPRSPLPSAAPIPMRWPVPFVPWWPALIVAVVVLLGFSGGVHGAGFFWWFIFPAFFWFRGGRRRHHYRGPFF
jgi:uncharacterized protein DUF1707